MITMRKFLDRSTLRIDVNSQILEHNQLSTSITSVNKEGCLEEYTIEQTRIAIVDAGLLDNSIRTNLSDEKPYCHFRTEFGQDCLVFFINEVHVAIAELSPVVPS